MLIWLHDVTTSQTGKAECLWLTILPAYHISPTIIPNPAQTAMGNIWKHSSHTFKRHHLLTSVLPKLNTFIDLFIIIFRVEFCLTASEKWSTWGNVAACSWCCPLHGSKWAASCPTPLYFTRAHTPVWDCSTTGLFLAPGAHILQLSNIIFFQPVTSKHFANISLNLSATGNAPCSHVSKQRNEAAPAIYK